MQKIKLFIMVLALTSLLAVGSPARSRAEDMDGMPPATVLVQDRENKMLVKHNFVYDAGMLFPMETDVDSGFYVKVRQ